MNPTSPPATFTPWRILLLLLIGPVAFMVTAATIYFGPAGGAISGADWRPTGEVLSCVGDCGR